MKNYDAIILVICVIFAWKMQGYAVQNLTDYSAKAEVSLICKDDAGLEHPATIDFSIDPHGGKDIPDTCRLTTIKADIKEPNGVKSTNVVSGAVSSGAISGLPPHWEINKTEEGFDNSGKNHYTIRISQ